MLRLRHPISLLLICALVLLGVLRSYSTPAPLDAGAPDVVFSADRAEAILRELLPEKLPHVAGSPYNSVIRNRVVAQLEASGYAPEIQSRFHCNPLYGTCSPVDNIIAVKPGAVGKHAVLLTAHYDSGWAGPGAADDGAAVAAILEIARMAADFPPFDNDVIFLFSDSEENGLIGADAFAEQGGDQPRSARRHRPQRHVRNRRRQPQHRPHAVEKRRAPGREFAGLRTL